MLFLTNSFSKNRRLRRRTEAQCESSLAFGLRVPIAICLYHSPPLVSLRPLLSCFLSCCLLVSTARVVSPTSSQQALGTSFFSLSATTDDETRSGTAHTAPASGDHHRRAESTFFSTIFSFFFFSVRLVDCFFPQATAMPTTGGDPTGPDGFPTTLAVESYLYDSPTFYSILFY